MNYNVNFHDFINKIMKCIYENVQGQRWKRNEKLFNILKWVRDAKVDVFL